MAGSFRLDEAVVAVRPSVYDLDAVVESVKTKNARSSSSMAMTASSRDMGCVV